ncbi:unnamed protein product [Laminaria digitata]
MQRVAFIVEECIIVSAASAGVNQTTAIYVNIHVRTLNRRVFRFPPSFARKKNEKTTGPPPVGYNYLQQQKQATAFSCGVLWFRRVFFLCRAKYRREMICMGYDPMSFFITLSYIYVFLGHSPWTNSTICRRMNRMLLQNLRRHNTAIIGTLLYCLPQRLASTSRWTLSYAGLQNLPQIDES